MITVLEPIEAQNFCKRLKIMKEERLKLSYDMILKSKELQRAKNLVYEKEREIKELIDTL